MQRSPEAAIGEKIGEGTYADIHAWAPGQVVKLFKPRVPMELGWHEAQMTQAVFGAGGPAPEMMGVMTLGGRFAMVLPRFDGPTLLKLSRSGALKHEEVGNLLAALFLAVHKTAPPAGVPDLYTSIEGSLRSGHGAIPTHIGAGILALIERLAPKDGLCHGDLHPDNVIMTADGPRLIDWIGAVRGPAALDLACTHFLLDEIAPEYVDDPERPRTIDAVMRAEYARLAGVSPAVLTATIETYMPIVYFRALLGGALPDHRERLIRRLEETLSRTG